jgi:hypothetical protein
MTTLDDDFVRIEMQGGTKNILCKSLGIDWPPPEEIDFCGFTFVKIRQSQFTDEQMETLTHVCRGALYQPKKEDDFEEMDGSAAMKATVEELY